MDDAAAARREEPGRLDARLGPTTFDALPGWRADDHAAAFQAFRRSALRIADDAPKTRALGISGVGLQVAARAALARSAECGAEDARRFFEQHFKPCRRSRSGLRHGLLRAGGGRRARSGRRVFQFLCIDGRTTSSMFRTRAAPGLGRRHPLRPSHVDRAGALFRPRGDRGGGSGQPWDRACLAAELRSTPFSSMSRVRRD